MNRFQRALKAAFFSTFVLHIIVYDNLMKNIFNYTAVPPRRLIRLISVMNIVPAAVLLPIMSPKLLLPAFCCNIGVSISILLMIPDTFRDYVSSFWFALVTMLLSAAASAVVGLCEDRKILVTVYSFVSLVPLAVCYGVRIVKMMGDVDYLTTKVSGWEIMLCLVKHCMLSVFMIIMACSCLTAAFYPTMTIMALPVSVLFYVLVYARITSAGPIVTFTAGSGENDESDEVKPQGVFMASSIRVNYKTMYNRLCFLLDQKKPFLDPEYSMDSLVKSLCSNKAYISKIINECTGMNFNQLMNRYRVNYAKELYAKDMNLKVKDLSDMSGFHTQVSFITAFKLFNDETPGAWCKTFKDSRTKDKRCLSSQPELAR
mgnify:FL=1